MRHILCAMCGRGQCGPRYMLSTLPSLAMRLLLTWFRGRPMSVLLRYSKRARLSATSGVACKGIHKSQNPSSLTYCVSKSRGKFSISTIRLNSESKSSIRTNRTSLFILHNTKDPLGSICCKTVRPWLSFTIGTQIFPHKPQSCYVVYRKVIAL